MGEFDGFDVVVEVLKGELSLVFEVDSEGAVEAGGGGGGIGVRDWLGWLGWLSWLSWSWGGVCVGCVIVGGVCVGGILIGGILIGGVLGGVCGFIGWFIRIITSIRTILTIRIITIRRIIRHLQHHNLQQINIRISRLPIINLIARNIRPIPLLLAVPPIPVVQ